MEHVVSADETNILWGDELFLYITYDVTLPRLESYNTSCWKGYGGPGRVI